MELYDLLVLAQHDDHDAIVTIIQRFMPKIKKSLYQTSTNYREDLEQELITKCLEIIRSYKLLS